MVAGQEEKFDRIFRRYYREIRNYITGMLPTHAEDIVQETFMTLFDRLEDIDETTVRAWLYRVASNKGVDMLRATRTPPGKSQEPPSTPTETTQIQALVRLCMDRLEPRQAQILHLYCCGLSYDEMALVLDVQKSSISQLLLRAKRALEHQYQSFPSP